MPYMTKIKKGDAFGKGKYVNSKQNTECVEFVRQVAGAPATSLWTKGKKIKDAKEPEIAVGTAIANFDGKGQYPSDQNGRHAAIYLAHDKAGIRVLDQWNSQREVKERTIRFDRPANTRRSNDGDTFYVIE